MGFIEKVVGLMNGSQEQQPETGDSPAQEPSPEQAAATEETAAEEKDTAIPTTQEELDQLLATKKQEWEAERKAAEQERLRNLPEAERLKQEQLSKDAEISQLKAEINKRDLQAEIIAKLDERRLPVSIAELLPYEDRESTMKHLDKLMGVFETAVQDGVMLRLRGKTPEGLGRAAKQENSTTDPFAKSFANAFKK